MLRSIACAAALLLAACQAQSPENKGQTAEGPAVAPILTGEDAVDTHSYAKPLEARVANVDLDLALDFDSKKVSGTAALDVIAQPNVREVILDSKGLAVEKVTDSVGKPLEYSLGATDPEKGAPLAVTLPGDGKQRIIIH